LRFLPWPDSSSTPAPVEAEAAGSAAGGWRPGVGRDTPGAADSYGAEAGETARGEKRTGNPHSARHHGEGPYKAYVRSPSFVHLSTAGQLIHGHLIADVVPIFGMINMIGGECDK
jgi:hypothetical protein